MKKFCIWVLICMFCISQEMVVFAKDFSDREHEMNEKCAAIYDVETQQECEQYQEYLEQKNKNLDNEIKDIESQISVVGDDIDALSEQVLQNTKELKNLSTQIEQIQINIETANRVIQKLNQQIEKKENDMNQRNQQMKQRLIELQVYSGSNNLLDFLMGASSFADFIRRSEILGELNSYENELIQQLKKEKEQLDEDKKSVEVQTSILHTQKQNLENSKKRMEKLNTVNETLIATYRKKEQSLMDQKVAAQREQSTIPKIDTSLIPVEIIEEEVVEKEETNSENQENQSQESNKEQQSNQNTTNQQEHTNNQNTTNNQGNTSTGWKPSDGLIVPIIGDWYYSAGTWEYPNHGGAHFGMDFATRDVTGLQVVAPANGIVIWAYNGCDNNGYLGNSCGNPINGGNTIVVVVRVKNATYAISFSHLTSANAAIGSMVTQGQVIGYTGNSGSSTGPHCHVEVIYLGNISLQEAVHWYNTGGGITYPGDTTFGAGWNTANACGSPPCRMRPESFWL